MCELLVDNLICGCVCVYVRSLLEAEKDEEED